MIKSVDKEKKVTQCNKARKYKYITTTRSIPKMQGIRIVLGREEVSIFFAHSLVE